MTKQIKYFKSPGCVNHEAGQQTKVVRSGDKTNLIPCPMFAKVQCKAEPNQNI